MCEDILLIALNVRTIQIVDLVVWDALIQRER